MRGACRSGGVFAPPLFMGAMLGSAYGAIAHDALRHLAAAAGACGLVGMGASSPPLRGRRSPRSIIFELTGDDRVILPLMIAVGVATAIATRRRGTRSQAFLNAPERTRTSTS